MSAVVAAVLAGARLAFAYNPVFAGIFASAAAALCARRGHRVMTAVGVALLAAGWLLGDGTRVIASARDLAGGAQPLLAAAPQWANIVALAVWGVAGLVLGYALPAWSGAFVGRRVTMGTGWLSAIVVSASCSAAVATIVAAGG